VVRKGPTATGAKKGSILSSKKTQKLGAKKVTSGDVIDFDEAERKAKEEAERIQKLGYDPEAEQAEIDAKEKTTPITTIASPTPISPSRAATSKAPEKSASEMERLGMGVSRLGFGQVSKPVIAKKAGFGAVAPAARTAADGMYLLLFFFFFFFLRRHSLIHRRRGNFTNKIPIRCPERHLIRRILQARQIRPCSTSRGQDSPGQFRGRHIDLQQCVFRTA
jgi:hypothetical protein